MDMLTNVTSSVSSWWGKGLKRGEEPEKKEGEEVKTEEAPPPSTETAVTTAEEELIPTSEEKAPSPTTSEKSPPTSEADSASIGSQPEETPLEADASKTGEKGPGFGGIAVDIEEVSTKALQSAKNIGSFLFSVGKKAGKTVTDTASKIKHTVEENSILGEFNKEQEAFVQEKNQQQTEAAVPPWVGYPEEETLKQQILALSQDRRNFVRSPPSGVTFEFDYNAIYPVAQATLAEDPNLEKMRFELVPKSINEENFWRNYFYRVSLIKQSTQLSSLAQEAGDSSSKSSRKSSVDEGKGGEEEWEKELQQELQEYEVVNEGEQAPMDDAEWEKEIQKVLGTENKA